MKTREQVLAVDNAFCNDCRRGKEKAWASYFLEDGMMITDKTGGKYVGKESIEEHMVDIFQLPDMKLHWSPDHVELSDDRSLAVTKGPSTLSFTKEGKKEIHHGYYTTVWKRRNKLWKIKWVISTVYKKERV